jgi:hypothetical protein
MAQHRVAGPGWTNITLAREGLSQETSHVAKDAYRTVEDTDGDDIHEGFDAGARGPFSLARVVEPQCEPTSEGIPGAAGHALVNVVRDRPARRPEGVI